ncbi:MAG: LysM peptidoglycan-binding domain-containing protein [Porticoccaceae bacterium]|nr:LysM peptidoglycan-binding domain-containing protein [Porticoccaceae bacterium]
MVRLILSLVVLGFSSLSLAEGLFPRPAELQRDVDFWVKIYTEVDTNSGLLHDPWNLAVIYEQVELPAHASREQRQKVIDQARSRYQNALQQLAAGKRSKLSAEEQKALNAWPKGTDNQRFRQAAEEIRFQLGQSNRFREGLVRSGQWRDHIRRTLAEYGLPQELEVLPHVESSFNPGVYSRVAAAGMWQFMPATAKQYMTVDHLMDERLDPYVSTDAAARLLKNNFRITGTWPLALTGYNHGVNGVSRAASAMGTTDIARLVREYRGPAFGFASRNFYVSFLAALEVDRNAEKYFGPIAMAKPIDYDRVTLQEYLDVPTLARAMGTSVETLRRYNPALLAPVWNGEKRIPHGYTVKFPRHQLSQPLAQLVASIPAAQRYAYQQPDVLHRIASGETLSHIAKRYKVSVRELMALNGLKDHNIRAGRTLRLPGRVDVDTRVASTAGAGDNGIYVIQPGDSLWGIAKRFNRTEKELLAWNTLNDKNRIRPGDTLRVALNDY